MLAGTSVTHPGVVSDMLNDLLRHQDGVVTLEQACRAGVSVDAIKRKVRSGQWRACFAGVYFADDRPFTPAARVRAAVWSCGTRSVASGPTAAWWLGLITDPPEVVDVTVPRHANGRAAPGIRTRRRDLAAIDIVQERRLRVTALPLTVLEAAATRGGGSAIMDRALQRHLELPALWSAHLRNKGRYGAPAARRLLQSAGSGARSEAERLLIRLLQASRTEGWIANHPVAGYVVDVAFPVQRVAIEVDGWAFHSAQAAFQRDRIRQNAIAVSGWQVLRFTWVDLTEHPQRVISIVRKAISVQ